MRSRWRTNWRIPLLGSAAFQFFSLRHRYWTDCASGDATRTARALAQVRAVVVAEIGAGNFGVLGGGGPGFGWDLLHARGTASVGEGGGKGRIWARHVEAARNSIAPRLKFLKKIFKTLSAASPLWKYQQGQAGMDGSCRPPDTGCGPPGHAQATLREALATNRPRASAWHKDRPNPAVRLRNI